MSDAVIVVLAIVAFIITLFVTGATFLRLACWFCRVEIPWYSHAIWIVFLDAFACGLVAAIGNRILGSIATDNGVASVIWMRLLTAMVSIPLIMVVSAYVYSWAIPTDFGKALLIKATHNTIGIVFGLGIVLLLPPSITQALAQRHAASPADPFAIRSFLNQMSGKWKTAIMTLQTAPPRNQAGVQHEAARSGGTLVSSSPKWRLLEIKDIGIALTKEGMPRKATAGRFVLVAYQGTSKAASSRVMYFPTLVDSQDRQFKPISESPLYLSKGQRFMTVTRLSSDVTETFHSIYEVAADSQGLHFLGQRPPEGFEKKTPL